MEIEKQECNHNLFYLESQSRGLMLFRSYSTPNHYLICTPYCTWHFTEEGISQGVKRVGDLYCTSVGKNSIDATDKERIAFYISNLPNEYSAKNMNFAQTCEWIIHRTLAIRVAKCFLAGHSESDAPLDWELNIGTIDKYQINYNYLISDRLENLWRLVSRQENKIKQALIKKWGYPFNNRLEFFQEITKPLIEENFLKCLRSNYLNRPREVKRLVTLSRHHVKGKDLSQEENEKLSKLIKKNYLPQNPWRDRLIEVATDLAVKDDVIRAYVEIDKTLTDTLLAMNQKASSNPNFKDHAEKLYAWRRGNWYRE